MFLFLDIRIQTNDNRLAVLDDLAADAEMGLWSSLIPFIFFALIILE